MRHGKEHALSVIRRVGQYFLIARHAGIEHQLEHGIGFRTESLAFDHGPILQNKRRNLHEFIT